MRGRHHGFTLVRPSALVAVLALLVPISLVAGPQQPQTQRNEERQHNTDKSWQSAMLVTLGDVEDHPLMYVGKRITVTGEIERILGPRLFSVDERNWIDFDGETLVVVPKTMIAVAREDQPVSITGTVRRFVKADIEHEWGWFDDQPRIEAEFTNRPVLVADSVTTVGDNVSVLMILDRTGKASQSNATQNGQFTARTGQAAKATMTDISELTRTTDERFVGRMVNLQNAKVASTVASGGFWIASEDNERLFVLPSDGAKVQQGQLVRIMGRVLELPNQMKDRLDTGNGAQGEDIYVYGTQVKQAG
jgi:hypothetical protein